MTLPRSLVLLIQLLWSATLLVAPTPSLAARSPDGAFSGWRLSDVAAHPTSHTAYIVDNYAVIRTVDGVTGRTQPPAATIAASPTFVEGIAVNGVSNEVYALTALYAGRPSYALVTLSADLKLLSNVSLTTTLSPPLPAADSLYSTIFTDEKGLLYIVRRLANSTRLVHVLQGGKQVNVWTAPLPTSSSYAYLLAMGPGGRLHFQSFDASSRPGPLYIVSPAGELAATLTLPLPPPYWYDWELGSLAVTRGGDVAISPGYGLYLFNATGALVTSFVWQSLDTFHWGLWRLVVDAADRLLGLDDLYLGSVQVVSSTSGDELTTWSNGVPSLRDINSFTYERRTSSLIVSQALSGGSPVLRLDAGSGYVIQEYAAMGRMQRCQPMTTFVVPSGNIFQLLRCAPAFTWTTTVLQEMTPAGQLRRELVLPGWSPTQMQSALVVSEDRQLFYVLSALRQTDRSAVNRLMVFTFNGTNLFNATDPRIGNIDQSQSQMLLVNNSTLAVVDPSNYRIFLLNLDTGLVVSQLTVPTTTRILGAAYDGATWYRSELTSTTSPPSYAVNQYAANGSLLAQYALDMAGSADNVPLSVDTGGRRLYALRNPQMYPGLQAVLWWDMAAHDGEQQPPTEGAVRRIQPSGVYELGGHATRSSRSRSREAKRLARAAKLHAGAGLGEPSKPVEDARGESPVAAVMRRGGQSRPERLQQRSARRAQTTCEHEVGRACS